MNGRDRSRAGRRPVALLTAATLAAAAGSPGAAGAVDIPEVGGKTLSLDISNTSEVGYHFDNRNDTGAEDGTVQTLIPSQQVDDNYGQWLNRLFLRARYWKLSLDVRLDSAVFFNTLSRQDAQDLIRDRLGEPGDLSLENRFGQELHSRYTSHIYPAKLSLRYTMPGLEATVGDFYENLGRGLVFSVRKIDEVGIDTTVRGGKIKLRKKFDDLKLSGTLFGGQLNPIRMDFPTGRILHGWGSPLFFGFPTTSDFSYYPSDAATELSSDPARPSYLEDNIIGGNLEYGIRQVQFGFNTAVLLRQPNSAEQLWCLRQGGDAGACAAEHPSFNSPEASRAHDQIQNFSGSVRIPPIARTFDAYFELARQRLLDGRVTSVDAAGEATAAEPNLDGWAIYGNVNINVGPITATLEGKHYRSFFRLGANIDTATLGFGAPEFNVISYSQPPTTESIYVEPIGSPDVCISGGRGKVDGSITGFGKVYGWVGHYVSFSEIDASNNECDEADSKRTNTWDTAAGVELEAEQGKTHAMLWAGARLTDRSVAAIPNALAAAETAVFYREGYVRYDLIKHLTGAFSLTAQGYHRRRYEPNALSVPWNEGENLLALNWAPNWSFIFGYEYQTRSGFPTHYFNGAIQYRSKSDKEIYHQIFDSVQVFVGQRRAALRCVAGVCRVFPAFEGAKLELVSRF